MSTTIDEKVVEMRFDNKQFEDGVRTSMNTLDKLKETLNLNGAAKGLSEIESTTKNFNMNGLSGALDTVKNRFSALEIVGITALANITNSAVNAGKRILKSLTIAPVTQGFQEYELKMGSIQTIMASTGESLKTVNRYLDELNTYSDKTIYSFSDMTTNIGKFTNAGVKLKDAVAAIQGISNEAAVSGANANEASRAMYNFAQALSAGYVKLIDWKSIENANMATVEFKNELIKTALAAGTLEKASDGMYKVLTTNAAGSTFKEAISATRNFNDSLGYQWMTTEVLTKTLAKYADETTEIGKKAFAAAQDVKTFSMMMDTLKEAAGSGWARTWELLIGDFEEAKKLWTELSEIFGKVIQDSADFRNNILESFKELGGREDVINSAINFIHAIGSITGPVKRAFTEVFEELNGKSLKAMSAGLVKFTESLTLTNSQSAKWQGTLEGLFSVLHLFSKGLGLAVKAITKVVSSKGFDALLDIVLSVTSAFSKFFVVLDKGFSGGLIDKTVSSAIGGLSALLEGLASALDLITGKMPDVGKGIGQILSGIGKAFANLFTAISENITLGDVVAALLGGSMVALNQQLTAIVAMFKEQIANIFGTLKKETSSVSIKGTFVKTLDTLHNSLTEFTKGLKIGSIVAIAVALGIMASALDKLSKIKMGDMLEALGAMAVTMRILTTSYRTILKYTASIGVKSIIKAAVGLVILAEALKTMSEALVNLGSVSLKGLAGGLVSLGASIQILIRALKKLSNFKVSFKPLIALALLAEITKTLGESLKGFAKLSWKEIGQGLSGMAGSLIEMVAAVKILDKVTAKSIIGTISLGILADSLANISDALSKLGMMTWDEIGRGLTAMGGALAELVASAAILGRFGGFSSLFGAEAIKILTTSLSSISTTLQDLGLMSWSEIGRGLTAMGGALAELVVAAAALGKIAPISGMLGGKAIQIVSTALTNISNTLTTLGDMSWKQIKRGLTAMGGALAELSITAGALGKLAPLSGILGGEAIKIVSTSLGDIAVSLEKFGDIPWDKAKNGLKSMGLALAEIAGGGFVNTFAIFGSKAIANMAIPLGDLADSVKKWENVKVPNNIGNNLAMLANGIFSFTLDGMGASAIAKVGKPLGVMADSVTKWADIQIPSDLGENLFTLSKAVRKFTFSGIGANALSKVAKPLGVLGVSVSKWAKFKVPENLGTDLATLADGIKKFTWAFLSGLSIDAVAKPLGKLAKSVLMWKKVTLPETLPNDLTALATGLKSFSWLFTAASTLKTVTASLSSMATAVTKFTTIKSASKVGATVEAIGNSIGKFVNAIPMSSTAKVNAAAEIASSISKMTSAMSKASKISGEGIDNFIKSVKKVSNIEVNTSNLKTVASDVSSSVKSMMNSMTTTITGSKGNIQKSLSTALGGITAAVKSKNSEFTTAGKGVVTKIVSGINANKKSMETSGVNLAKGLIIGINSKKTDVYNAAFALGKKAVEGEKDGQESESPSKATIRAGKWLGEGLVIGMDKMGGTVYKAGRSLGEKATAVISDAVDSMAELASDSAVTNPVITPVVDLTEARKGTSALSDLFNKSKSMELSSNLNYVSRSMNAKTADSTNADIVNAVIDGLQKLDETVTGQNGGDPQQITVEVPLNINGREFARATVSDIQDQINVQQTRSDRMVGVR